MIENLRTYLRRSGSPFSIILAVLFGLFYVLTFFVKGVRPHFAFEYAFFGSYPAGAILYPFLLGPVGNAVFTILTVVFFIASIEKTIGTPLSIKLWLGSTLLGAAGVAIGDALFHYNATLFGATIPIESLILYWATKFPRQRVVLLFFPVEAWVVAAIGVCFVFFGYGAGNPLVGLFALTPLFVIGLYSWSENPKSRVKNPRYSSTAQVSEKDFYEDSEKRRKDRLERERLRKIFEQSMIEDPDDKAQ